MPKTIVNALRIQSADVTLVPVTHETGESLAFSSVKASNLRFFQCELGVIPGATAFVFDFAKLR